MAKEKKSGLKFSSSDPDVMISGEGQTKSWGDLFAWIKRLFSKEK